MDQLRHFFPGLNRHAVDLHYHVARFDAGFFRRKSRHYLAYHRKRRRLAHTPEIYNDRKERNGKEIIHQRAEKSDYSPLVPGLGQEFIRMTCACFDILAGILTMHPEGWRVSGTWFRRK